MVQVATSYFPEWTQRVAGVLSQANSCTQAHSDMFQFAFTRAIDQMSRSSPSSRGSSGPWYTVSGKMSDKNLEQRINIKFCVKIGKSASETLTLLTVFLVNKL
jgi:hypothetical protein